MTDTVSLTTLPARTLVHLRGTVPDYAGEGLLWERFLPALQAQDIVPIGPGGCIEHDDEFRESDVDESVFLEVPAGTVAASPLDVIDAPSTRAVEAVVDGPYAEAIPRAHEVIGAYVAEHGLTLARTVDDPATMDRLLDAGVDGIITDRPDVLRTVMIQRGTWAAMRGRRASGRGDLASAASVI